MEVNFDKSFLKSLEKINDKAVFKKIEKAIIHCESANTLLEIPNLKKLKGFANFYRIKIGDYRIGVEVEGNSINFIIVLHRKDIYKLFP